MPKITIPGLVGDAYFHDLAQALTRLIAVDPTVSLTNDTMEGEKSIGIDTWSEVADTIETCLQQWAYQFQTRSPFTVPIPVPIYNLLYILCERMVSDIRGEVEIKITWPEVHPAPTGSSSALFGVDGFYHGKYSSYAGDAYLNEGVPRPPRIYKIRETKITSSNKTPIAVHDSDYPVGKIPIRVQSSSEGTHIFTGIDGYSVHCQGFLGLVPPVAIEDEDLEILQGRCVELNDARLNDINDLLLDSDIAAEWINSSGPDRSVAIRAVMAYQVNQDVFLEYPRSLLVAERFVPYRDLPTTLERLPAKHDTDELVALALFMVNPHMTIKGNQVRNEALHAFASEIKKSLAPLALTESVRAHIRRFVTFNGKEDKATGAIFTSPAFDDGSHVQKLLSDSKLPEREYEKVRESLAVWRDILTQYPCLTPAPLISLDYNKLPITVKYCLLVQGDDLKDKTGSDWPVSTGTTLVGENLIRLYLRQGYAGVSGGTGGIKNNFVAFLESLGFGKLDDAAIDVMVKELAAYGNLHGDKLENPAITVELEAALHNWSVLDNHPIDGVFDKKKPYYYFTKFKEPELAKSAEQFQNALFFPILPASYSHSLVINGYKKVSRVRLWNAILVSSASIQTGGKPRTEYGYVLQMLARKGGFGFAKLLGPLAGTLGGLLGNAIGIPQLGDIAQGIAGALPF